MAQAAVQTKSKKDSKSVESAARIKNNQQSTFTSSPDKNGGAVNAFYAAGPVLNLMTPIQAKVTIGKADDPYEREADNVAEHVVSGQNAPPVTPIPASGLGNIARLQSGEDAEDTPAQMMPVQRIEDEETGDASVQAKLVQRMGEDETEDTSAQTKPIQRMEGEEAGDASVQAKRVQRMGEDETEDSSAQTKPIQRMEDEEASDTAVQSKQASTGRDAESGTMEKAANKAINNSGTGEPLNDSLKHTMESSMGVGLGDVRVHQDNAAHESAGDLKARAFTNKNHIWLGRGESQSNVRLMAHETTHVLQQTGTVQRQLIQRESAELQVASDKLPTEAEKAIALAAAKVAELLAGQAAATGKNEIAKSKTDELAEQEAGKVAKEEVALAEGATDAVSTEALPGEEGAQGEAPAEQEKGKEQTIANAAKTGAGTTEEASVSDKAPISAREDSAFKAVLSKIEGVASQQRAHDPAITKAEQAQSSAESPQTELEGKAQDTQVGAMEEAETPAFDAVAFKTQLMDRIKALAPKTVKEADDFKKNDKLGALKGDMQNSVAEQKTASQKPMAEQTAAPPDVAGAEAKSVTPLTPADPGLPPASVGAQQAAPKSKGQSELETPLVEASAQVGSKMLDADVDEEQLKKANEPEFQGAVDAKSEASDHAEQGPMQYREFEQGQISQAEQVAAATATERAQGMHAERGGLLTQVEGQQGQTKSKDELARDKIADDISKIYEKTKTNVETRLGELDGKVTKVFDEGAGAAKQAFEDYVEAKMDAYKEERYGGLFGWARWGKDKLLGMPSAVNAFYTEGRQLYLDKMDAVIDNVVALVGTELTEAKADIATGKQEIKDYVTQLPDDLKTVGEEASTEIADKFDELEQSIDDKQNELIESLANKYQDNLKAVDVRIDELKAANQGLVDKAMNAVVGVIKIILKLKDMLTTVLAKIAAVVGKIIKDPIGFLGNLISGLMQGFVNFKDNIGTHLQKGLIGWLTGALGPVGVQIPDDLFSLKGIFSLVSQVLGLTWDYVRKKASKLLGEPVVKGLETAFTPFRILITEGPAGLWEFVKDEFNDLKEMVMDKIKEMVITEVIKAGVKWILGMLNPASAFIKAAMAIYDIVMFFINQGSRILELVNSIIDAVGAIANGSIGAATKMVETALAKALPIVIGFLANLLGIGGLAKKVQDLIKRIRKRIDKAIDKLILKARKMLKGKGVDKRTGKKIVEKKILPQEAVKLISKRLSSKAGKISGKDNRLVGEIMQGIYRKESKWVEKNVKGINKKTKLLLIPQGNENQWWIDVKINPTEKTTMFPRVPNADKGTGGAGMINAKKVIGMFHGANYKKESSIDLKEEDLKGTKGDGTGLELGSGLYLSHHFPDAAGYAQVTSKKDDDNRGWMHKFWVPQYILSTVSNAEKPDPQAGDDKWKHKGDVLKGEWKHIGTGSWKAGFQWVIKSIKTINEKLKLEAALKPLTAADKWGRGRRKEYPSLYSGTIKPPLEEGRKLARIGSKKDFGERETPQNKPGE